MLAIEAVEYVVRPKPTGKGFTVWMIELDAAVKPARFITSTAVSDHRGFDAAEKKAAQLRQRDEVHIDKVMARA